jgi:hypothetical protein
VSSWTHLFVKSISKESFESSLSGIFSLRVV